MKDVRGRKCHINKEQLGTLHNRSLLHFPATNHVERLASRGEVHPTPVVLKELSQNSNAVSQSNPKL